MNQHHHMQWDRVIPKRRLEWEDGQGDLAVLLVPRFRRGPLSKWLQPRLKRPHIRVKLDRIGSFVWRRMDGAKTFNQVLGEMRTEFGETIEPAEDRLIKFFSILHKDRFIELYTSADEKP
jgi:hypothetical protein